MAAAPWKVKIAQADVPNKNGRTYPVAILEALCGPKPVFGQMGMPTGRDVEKPIPIHRMSHQIVNLRMEKDFLVGEVQTLKTAEGLKMEAMSKKDKKALDFRVAGIGDVRDGVITKFALISINAIKDGA